MSVPLDISLISQLLNEQRTQGDLNNLTKPGFFYVTQPTNTPNNISGWCHVINLVNYVDPVTKKDMRIFQIYINDHHVNNTVWYRQYGAKQDAVGWTGWERFVTATDLSNSMSTKVNNSDLVADYYNKTDVDALINTINSALDNKASYLKTPIENFATKIYDNNGTAHSETTDNGYILSVGRVSVDLLVQTRASFTLQDDYPDNTKFTKIAISTEAFTPWQILPATITIVFDANTEIVATLDTDNSDSEFFIYTVPTNLQTVPIGKGTFFNVYF